MTDISRRQFIGASGFTLAAIIVGGYRVVTGPLINLYETTVPEFVDLQLGNLVYIPDWNNSSNLPTEIRQLATDRSWRYIEETIADYPYLELVDSKEIEGPIFPSYDDPLTNGMTLGVRVTVRAPYEAALRDNLIEPL